MTEDEIKQLADHYRTTDPGYPTASVEAVIRLIRLVIQAERNATTSDGVDYSSITRQVS